MLLLVAIVISVVVMCESVDTIREANPQLLVKAEWLFTILFTIEYGVRIICARRPLRYIFKLAHRLSEAQALRDCRQDQEF